MIKLKDLIEEEQLDEKAYVDTNATFELKGFGGSDLHIKGKNLDITLSFKGKDLQNAVKSGKLSLDELKKALASLE